MVTAQVLLSLILTVRSLNAMRSFRLVLIVYDEDGNVQAMEKTYAGLPNTSASVHCRRRRNERVQVADHQ